MQPRGRAGAEPRADPNLCVPGAAHSAGVAQYPRCDQIFPARVAPAKQDDKGTVGVLNHLGRWLAGARSDAGKSTPLSTRAGSPGPRTARGQRYPAAPRVDLGIQNLDRDGAGTNRAFEQRLDADAFLKYAE